MTDREARYWAKVNRQALDECWPWVAFQNPLGYGMFKGGSEQLAHRFGYRLAYGDIPDGMTVCHVCDNPPCQNPGHLFLGTHRDNMEDMAAKGRTNPPHLRGETNGRATLTASAVADIRSQYAAGATQKNLAERFGISRSQVGRICRDQHWVSGNPIDGSRRRAGRNSGRHPQAKLTEVQVSEIVARYRGGAVSQAALGAEYGVSQASISALIRGSS